MNKKMISEKSYKEIIIRRNGTKQVRTINNDVSMANTDGMEQADINHIVREFGRTGHWPVSTKQGIYSDATLTPTDLISAHSLVNDAREKFEALPSKIRERFHNDPVQLHQFLNNPSNKQEAVKLGLLTAEPKTNDELNDEKKHQPKPKSKPASQNDTE